MTGRQDEKCLETVVSRALVEDDAVYVLDAVVLAAQLVNDLYA